MLASAQVPLDWLRRTPIEHTSSAAASTMVDNEKPNDTSLEMCVKELKDHGLKSGLEMVRITVRRKMLWQDYKRAINRYYQPDRLLKITLSQPLMMVARGENFFQVNYACMFLQLFGISIFHEQNLDIYSFCELTMT